MKFSIRCTFLAVGMALAAGFAGCTRPDPAPRVWVAGPMRRLTNRTEPSTDYDVHNMTGKTIRLHAAANETVAVQLIVDAPADGLEDVTVAVDDLKMGKQVIASDSVKIFRCLPIPIREYPAWYLRLSSEEPQPADYYDPMLPADAPKGGQPWSLKPGRRLVLWLDVPVPADAVGGDYVGKVRIGAAGRADYVKPLQLRVHDFVLPDARPLAAIGSFDHRAIFRRFVTRDGKPYVPEHLDVDNPAVRPGLVVIRELMTLAHEHHIDLFDRRLAPLLKRDEKGQLRLIWDDYDAIVKPYLTGSAFKDRLGVPAWPLPYHDRLPDPQYYGGRGSDTWQQTAVQLLKLSENHFRDMGVQKQAIIWPRRDGVSEEAYRTYMSLIDQVRKAGVTAPTLSRLPINPPAATGWTPPEDFAETVDMHAPPGHWFDPSSRPAGQGSPLAGSWLSPGLPPYVPSLGLLSSPADVRALPWIATKYNARGLFLDEVLNWDFPDAEQRVGARTRLFYPGTMAGIQGVLPSVRLKRLRRGMQDMAYLWILRRRNAELPADAALNALIRYAGLQAAGDNYLDARLDGWVTNPQTWTLARRVLSAEAEAAVHPDRPVRRRLRELRVSWQQLNDETRNVIVERVRSRLIPEDDRLRAVVRVDLYNQRNLPQEISLRLTGSGDSWKPDPPQEITIPGGRQQTVTLEATSASADLKSNSRGKIPFTLRLDGEHIAQRSVDASVPLLVAGKPTSRLVIDGRLKDWPLRKGNVASGFRLLGNRRRNGDPRAGRNTYAFVLADADDIYIAIRCTEPVLTAMTTRRSNRLRYDQLMLTGEDLVEVLLDPGADGQSPADLFHLVVKPNGVTVTEKGIRSDPPLGQARGWAAEADVAIGTMADTWIVEMRIPRRSFGRQSDARVWGINFMRFATQGAESSNWAGARRHYYDPANLGTLLIPPTDKP